MAWGDRKPMGSGPDHVPGRIRPRWLPCDRCRSRAPGFRMGPDFKLRLCGLCADAELKRRELPTYDSRAMGDMTAAPCRTRGK